MERPGERTVSRRLRANALRPGDAVGPWVIEGSLGRGGMGAVYAARGADGRRAALKLLLDVDRGLCRARFEREADLGRRLSHPGVCRVLSHGEQDGTPWVAFELVEGGKTLELHCEGKPLRDVLGLVVQVCDALQHAHDLGVVHRDIKPANIVVGADGRARLVDLGLARDLDGARLTKSNTIAGTPQFLAPELVRGGSHAADPRSDVFSLGVLLFALVGGQLPFDGPTPPSILAAIMTGRRPDLRALRPDVPPDLATIVEAAIAADPARRPPTARALAEALLAVRDGRPLPVGLDEARPAPAAPRLLAAVGVAAAAVVGLVAATILGGGGPPGGDPARLEALEREVDQALADRGPARPDALVALLAARAALPGEAPRLDARLSALHGLAALGEGDAPGARAELAELDRRAGAAAAEPAVAALRGALLVDEAPGAAELLLQRAIAGGVVRPDVRAWRGAARAARALAAGDPEAGALARDALADLGPLAGRAPWAAAHARALLAAGRRAEAAAAAGQAAPPPDLAWALCAAEVAAEAGAAGEPAATARAVAARLAPLEGAPPPAARGRCAAAAAALRARALAALPLARRSDDGVARAGVALVAAAERLEPGRALDAPERAALLEGLARGGLDADTLVEASRLAASDPAYQRAVALLACALPLHVHGRFVEVARRALAGLPSGPERDELHVAYVGFLSVAGDHEACVREAAQLLPALGPGPDRARVQLARARAARGLGRTALALSAADAAVADSDAAWPRGERGLALRALGREAEAQEELVRYVEGGGEVGASSLLEQLALDVWRSSADDDLRRRVALGLANADRRYGGWLARAALLDARRGDLAAAAGLVERCAAAGVADGDGRRLPPPAGLPAALRGGGDGPVDALAGYVDRLDQVRGPAGARP